MSLVTWFDAITLGFILILGIKGIMNGLIKEVFGLIGLVGGFIFATRVEGVGSFINAKIYNIGNENIADFIGFLALFLIFWFVCLLVGMIVSKIIKESALGFLDRIGGFVFGCAKIFFIFAIFFAAISQISLINSQIAPVLKNSISYPIYLKAGKFIMDMDIDKIQSDINETINSTPKINLGDENNTKETQ